MSEAIHEIAMPRVTAVNQAINVGRFPSRHCHNSTKPLSEDQRMVVESMAEPMSNGAILILAGDFGIGKTHIASLYGIWWYHYGHSSRLGKARYWSYARLMMDEKAWYADSGQRTQPTELACDAGLLVLDELDTTNDSLHDQRTIKTVLDHRYMAGDKPTILLTNLEPENMTDAIDASILDRAKEGGGMIHMNSIQSLREQP